MQANPISLREAASAMQETTLPLEGLSSVCDKPVITRFDGNLLSSDSSVLALGEVERWL